LFLMKSCFELLDIYPNFEKMIETQFSKCIKAFRSDNVLEYIYLTFILDVLKHYGIILR